MQAAFFKQTDLLRPNGLRDFGGVSGVSREQIRLLKHPTSTTSSNPAKEDAGYYTTTESMSARQYILFSQPFARRTMLLRCLTTTKTAIAVATPRRSGVAGTNHTIVPSVAAASIDPSDM